MYLFFARLRCASILRRCAGPPHARGESNPARVPCCALPLLAANSAALTDVALCPSSRTCHASVCRLRLTNLCVSSSTFPAVLCHSVSRLSHSRRFHMHSMCTLSWTFFPSPPLQPFFMAVQVGSSQPAPARHPNFDSSLTHTYPVYLSYLHLSQSTQCVAFLHRRSLPRDSVRRVSVQAACVVSTPHKESSANTISFVKNVGGQRDAKVYP